MYLIEEVAYIKAIYYKSYKNVFFQYMKTSTLRLYRIEQP